MFIRRLSHVGAIACIFFYLLHLSWPIIRLFLIREQSDIIRASELVPQTTDPSKGPIPKIIHQVYLGFDNLSMPQHWETTRQTCIDLHPDYEYKLWTGESTRDLIKTKYPWFLVDFENYKYHVQQADSIRYLILAEYGGTYIDLDNGCKNRLDPLLQFDAWMPGVKASAGFSNGQMGSSPSHPYFNLLVNSLQSYNINHGTPYLTIMGSAGPHFVSFVWRKYLKRTAGVIPVQPRVRILMPAEVFDATGEAISDGSLIEDFFTQEKGGTWHTWDVKVFYWLRHHYSVVVPVVLTVFLLASALIWVLIRNTALAVRGVFRSSTFLWWRSRRGTRMHEIANKKYECA